MTTDTLNIRPHQADALAVIESARREIARDPDDVTPAYRLAGALRILLELAWPELSHAHRLVLGTIIAELEHDLEESLGNLACITDMLLAMPESAEQRAGLAFVLAAGEPLEGDG